MTPTDADDARRPSTHDSSLSEGGAASRADAAGPGLKTVVHWLVTSPRLPAGLLSAEAWDTVRSSVTVVAPAEHPQIEALCASGVDVALAGSAAEALELLEDGGVWLASTAPVDSDSDKSIDAVLVEEFAASTASGEISLEILYGSWDPPGARLLDLVEIIDQLRVDCPWQSAQGHRSLAPYLLEETYEALDAITDENRDALREELGDVLFQPLLHARIASEHASEPFSIDDVASDLIDKLIRRHPHVFGEADPANLFQLWDEAKAAEKPERRDDPATGVSEQLPALAYAAKVMDRFAMAGRPIEVPVLPESASRLMLDEVGTGIMLLAVIRVALQNGIDPELALRNTMRFVVASGGQVRRLPGNDGDGDSGEQHQ
ncbi:MazG family protein [Natronoglycomyces albus]|uniref:MazG family protein n=1 Tax=Natronoglycomyces albus TaxID=2811108 RepID=A0A895XQN2_9ACTN|nr:MazG family protein [Natronoglycomyces albus]QSB04580.1 MazG family protein [Natronoglycomyces albus]